MLKIENRKIITSDGTTYPTTSYIIACYQQWLLDFLFSEKKAIEKQEHLNYETRRIIYGINALIYELTNWFNK